ncbi:SigE family RNA polymerase sigma factor [Pimelobacter simplex]|uniref:Putative RNA polymerase sigma factor n=1 Tax=Nocardioides simplex TaxID=2045 RepID=A0A0C5WYS1_NOCSI|nr:SigE family RNA polymerase sigma factor [Pimelobacter simplex]AJR18448.1 putative RNA polymerase sigma factor [Pimelobacter simplex]GEB13680.1 hypothetical protein NSI01_19950 [Pimelobacter simplex]SFM70086.1 RNA polymerase sigma-70 factor, sigma-E family [Pimelobacter simplex]
MEPLLTDTLPADRDDTAFDAFVAARLPQLLKLGRALTGDEQRGADLVQDALERALPRWRKLDDPEGFVRRAMVNRSISVWRKLRRERLLPELPDAPPASASADRPHDHELFAAVRRLPPRQRAVIALRYYEDLTEAQTAEVLGCSVGTVKSQAHRALAVLREQLPTFADMTPADPEQVAGQVRDGVRRRQQARRRAAAVGAGALVIALVAVGAVLGLRGSDGPPSPTGRHDLRGLDRAEWPEDVQQIAITEKAAFAAAAPPDCGCTVLHRYDDGAWRRVHVFDDARVLGLTFAPDGEHGWAITTSGWALPGLELTTDPSRVVTTTDGGATWTPLRLPAPQRDGISFAGVQVVAQDDGAWVATAGEEVLRWFPAGSDRGEVVPLPDGRQPGSLAVAGDALLLTYEGAGNGAAATTDRGRTWTPVAFRCDSEDALYPSGGAVLALCGNDQTLYRWTPGDDQAAPYLHLPIEAPTAVVPIAGGRVAVLKENLDGWIVSPDGDESTSHGPPQSVVTGPSFVVGDTTYLTTLGGVFRTDDGDRWVAADGTGD